jgi:hypothetical protein
MAHPRVLLVLAILLVCEVAVADGNRLLSECLDTEQYMDTKKMHNAPAISRCLGLLQGVRNTMIILDSGLDPSLRVCWPKEGINNGQAVRIVLHYLKANPEQLHKDEVLLAMIAFRSAYPCNSSK